MGANKATEHPGGAEGGERGDEPSGGRWPVAGAAALLPSTTAGEEEKEKSGVAAVAEAEPWSLEATRGP